MTPGYEAQLIDWAKKGIPWAEAILVKAQHSSPLPPGARLALNARGDMTGAISMGCVESDLREHLQAVLTEGTPRQLHYGAGNDMVLEVGLSCGGEIDVLLRRQEQDEVWKALERRDPSKPALLLTSLSALSLGRQMLVFSDETSVGGLDTPGLDDAAKREAAILWDRGGTLCVKASEMEVFAENLEPAPRLAVVGASPIAAALCRMAACAGFEVAVVDPRRAYARTDLFPEAKQVVHEWPEEGFSALGVDAGWYVAILAHDEKLDVPALAAALRLNCRYVGLLGSRTTQEKRRARLREMAFSEEQMKRIHGPIGLRFGALEPAEIAVSILAELIAMRRGG